MRVVNIDTLSHQKKSPEKCLQMEEKYMKHKYLEDCLRQHRQLFPFFVFVENLLSVEADDTLKRISIHLVKKCKPPYSRTFGYVRSRAEMALVRTTYRCIWGYQDT